MEHAYQLLLRRYEGSALHINPCIPAEDGSYVEFPYEKGTALSQLLDECLEKDDMDGFYRLFDRYLDLISYGEESARFTAMC